MTARFEVSGNKTKIIFEYEAETSKMQSVIEDAAEYLFKETEEIKFSDLSNQQKLDLVDNHVKRVVLDLANTFKSVKAQDAARELESENKYEM